jgi:hypothetical protein
LSLATRARRTALGVEDDQEPSTRTRNVPEDIIGLAESGQGNTLPSVQGTCWAGYDGRGRNPATRLNNLWFGDSAAVNKQSPEAAPEMAA